MSVPAREPRRLWRLAAAVIICLLIGAAVNVLVAWSSCVRFPWVPPRWRTPPVLERAASEEWPARYSGAWGAPTRLEKSRTWNRVGYTATWYGKEVSEHGLIWNIRIVGAVRAGAPFRSLMFSDELDRDILNPPPPPLPTVPRTPVQDGWTVRTAWLRAIFPLRPIWPGFAFNTLIYAVIAYGLSRLPLMARRWRRGRRNQCPTCGYSRAGLAGGAKCPECGVGS